MSKKSKSAEVAAASLLFIGCALANLGQAAVAESNHKFKAHAEKSSVRLSRPTDSRAALHSTTSNDRLELKTNAFDLNTDAAQLNRAAAELDKWAAKSAVTEVRPAVKAPRNNMSVAQGAPAAVAIDYAAIEQAYRDAIPKPTVASTTVAAPEAGPAGAPVGLIGPMIANRPIGNAYVDVDNCACGTPVPTSNCMLNRQLNPGNPPNGMLVQPPQMRNGTAPGVFRGLNAGRH